MQQIGNRDGPGVEFGRGLEQQLGGGGYALRGGPDAQPVEAGLRLGPQHERGGRFLAASAVGDDDAAPVEVAAFQPGLQELGGGDHGTWREPGGKVGAELVAPSLLGLEPTLNFRADQAGVTHAAHLDVGQRDRATLVGEPTLSDGTSGRLAMSFGAGWD